MSEKTLKTRIRHAVKTESDWASLNPVLLSGEIAYNSDNDKYKVGNGTSTWSQLSYKIPVTKSDIGLGNVENKSSATIRGELTKDNVTKALGYTPPTTNTTYGVATSSALGLVKSGTDITVDSSGNVSVKDDSHNHIISNIDGLQNSLDTKATKTTLTNQDLNSIVTPGFYNAGGGNTVTNKPSGVNHFGLIVIHRASGSYYTQILFDDTSSYRRFCVNGNWGGWTQDKLTDTNTWRGIQNNLTSDSTTDSLSAAQGKMLKSLVDTKSASGHTHDDRYYTESEINTKLNTKLNTSLKGAASGLAELDSTGRVPSSQLPSYVDDVIEGYLYNSKFYKESAHTTQITGETGKIYVDLTSNKTYRWSGSAFVVISETLALGETSATAYRGDRGKIAYDHSQVAHAPSNAEVNQNAFSNVTVGSTTIAADSKTDTLTLVAGSNVTLTPDATNDKITITSTNTDTKVTQTAISSADYTNWRSLIWGASNSGTEGFTPSTVTDGVYTCNTLSVQPSSGTIRANVFKGNLSGNATTATKWTTPRTLSLTGAVTGSATIDGSGNVSLSTSVNHTHTKSQITDLQTSLDNKLDKTSYEYNKELSLGSSGKVCIGVFPCYDSNISIDIKSTTSITYHGTLIIATQNINASGGGSYTATVYGDEDNKLASSIKIQYVSGSNAFSIYINLPPWSKNILHIQCVALAGSPSNIATIIDSIPSTATIIPTNAFTHTHNYAGSSSAGGSATSAVKLDSSAGSATQPIYFSDGKPVSCAYSLGKSVPSDAVFTDTVYTHPTTAGNKHIPSGGSSGQILRWSADGTAVWGDDNNAELNNKTSVTIVRWS